MSIWHSKIFQGKSPPTIAATLVLGALGAVIGHWIGLPLPMLLGPLLLVALVAALGGKLLGHPPSLPSKWRAYFIPVLGTAIGASVPPDILAQVQLWWPTVLMVVVFVPVAHAASYGVYRLLGRVDRPTAYFSSMPGGFVEALELGESYRADMQMLAMLQFLRLILCIALIPLSFAIISGHAVGSNAGVEMPGSDVVLTAWDITILLACAVLGMAGAKALRLPAAGLLGPLVLSGLAHAGGLTAAAPPSWMIALTQMVVGTTLGSQFAGLELRKLWLALRLSVVAMVLSLLLALAISWPLAGLVGEPVAALILAFAPGGVSEMALVAISLNLSAVFVTLHHLVRILLAVVIGRVGIGLLKL